jgi:hypothetical protein
MTVEPRYVINQNDGIDTLHRNNSEKCNVDDADGAKAVDPLTARALERGGHIRLCGHCYPKDEAHL